MRFIHNKKLNFPDWILLAGLLLAGGFHEYISCGLSVAMSIYLLIRLRKAKKCAVSWDLLSVSVVVLGISYGVTALWAVDSGMAFVGFLKFLPIMLYVFCLWQEQPGDVLAVLPYFTAGMAVISAVGMQFAFCQSLFAVSGRLGGFFQYPNTFALLLLVSQLLLLKKNGKKIEDYITMALLIGGLLYTGSRAVFVLAVLANAAMLLTVADKKVRLGILLGFAAVAVTVGILALNEQSVFHRYLTISFTESTFVGRILYVRDALPLLLKHPFGMGYMGYYYTQTAIQTGVYSVMYIHNDLMQFLLDVGLVPGLLFAAGLIGWFCRKDIPVGEKIIAGVICLHSLFDFNLQFVGMFMLLILLTGKPVGKGKSVAIAVPIKAIATVFSCVCLYMGVALALSHWGSYAAADSLYPYNTNNKLAALEQTTDVNEAAELAQKIMEQNEAHYAPYTVLAKQCYAQGDFGNVIRYMNTAFEKNPFNHTQYEEYCQMLMVGVSLYQQAGDSQSVRACLAELVKTRQKLQSNTARLSTLGKMIDDQPVTTLPAELNIYIDQITKE